MSFSVYCLKSLTLIFSFLFNDEALIYQCQHFEQISFQFIMEYQQLISLTLTFQYWHPHSKFQQRYQLHKFKQSLEEDHFQLHRPIHMY